MKVFLKLTDSKSRYWMFEGAQTKNFLLSNLVFFLEAWGDRTTNPLSDCSGLRWEWLRLDKEYKDMVCLWSDDAIKKQAKVQDLSQQEQEAFDAAYEEYADKRRDDIPKLDMKIENYVEIVEKWQEIVLKQKPNFIVLSQDDSGYVDLIGKDELSQQDLADMKIEHEKYLKYKVAYDKYVESRPDIVDDLWHGPQSSEYEADWQKFYEPDDKP
jgi:hypothetical protein